MAKETNRINLYKIKPRITMASIDPQKKGYSLAYTDSNSRLFVHTGKSDLPPASRTKLK